MDCCTSAIYYMLFHKYMINQKTILQKIFSRIKVGSFRVEWWDSESNIYGAGKPQFTLKIKHARAIDKILKNLSLGFGESYMEDLIDIEGDIADVIRLANANTQAFAKRKSWLSGLVRGINLGASPQQSRQDIAHHYDLGNDFYRLWLDETMSYSCAYFRSPKDDLKTAQINKIDYILKKLNLKPGMKLLDIGCGWGWLIIRAAQQYKIKALGITHSKQQLKKIKERIKQENLKNLVKVQLADYRELKGNQLFDRIASVGMYEHVGKPNQKHYFKVIERLLKPQGVSLLHTITKQQELPMDAFIHKYIFPGTYVPSWREVINFLPNHDFHLIDVESLRRHYARTTDIWGQNFEKHVNKIRKMYNERFVRMWRVYLRGVMVAFEIGSLDLHQFLFTKGINNNLPQTREEWYK